MKKTFIILINLVLVVNLFSQGIPRSSGLGVRWGLWSTKKSASELYPPGYVVSTGFFGSLYFFSRVSDKLFLETSLGGVADSKIGGGDVEATVVTPLLFGVRYDLLSTKYGSSYQPYVGAGVGAYWVVHSLVGNSVITETDGRYGAYITGGINVVLLSWFGLNCDMKYHFVDLSNTPARNYTGLEFGFGFFFMWGKRREIFHVEDVRVVVKDIYPAYYQFYNTYPLALVAVKNTVDYPIEVKLRSNIEGYSERAQESGTIHIGPGETKDIPVHALFGSKLLNATQREPAVIDLEIEAKAGATHTRTLSAPVMIHDRNAWNGEINKLGFFLTPDDDNVLEISRSVANRIIAQESSTDPLRSFSIARDLYNELGKLEIRYHSDPNIPFYQDDRVQFASETQELRTGDCDDLVVFYASLLESAGIKTAFVDVHDPAKELAHVYLMFDTGLAPEQSGLISTNEKRYVLRKNSSGQSSVWIPVETTLIKAGFEEAWASGALQYLQDGELRHGLAEGWMKIIDMEWEGVNYAE